jgi:DNA gyrase subunit A
MATEKGIIKKTVLTAYSNPRAGGIIAITLEEGDSLIDVKLTSGDGKVLLASKQGQAIVFPEDKVRVIGRSGMGVIGMRMEKGDEVISMETPLPKSTILTVTENGYGKRTEIEEYRTTGRGGKGVINIKTSDRNGEVASVQEVKDDDQLMIIANTGKVIRLKIKNISLLGRNTQGVRLIRLEEGEKVVSVARLEEKEEEV